jgi:hypothetical protein
MAEPGRHDVTLTTLHEDLTAGFGDMREMRVPRFLSAGVEP